MPRWAVYTLLVVAILLVILCFLWICVKCCCRGRKKKRQRKEDKIHLMEANGKSNTTLVSAFVCVCVRLCVLFSTEYSMLWQVQQDTVDADYGATQQERGKLLYSLEFNAAQSEVCLQLSTRRQQRHI